MQYSLSSFWQGQIIKMNVKDNEANLKLSFCTQEDNIQLQEAQIIYYFCCKTV